MPKTENASYRCVHCKKTVIAPPTSIAFRSHQCKDCYVSHAEGIVVTERALRTVESGDFFRSQDEIEAREQRWRAEAKREALVMWLFAVPAAVLIGGLVEWFFVIHLEEILDFVASSRLDVLSAILRCLVGCCSWWLPAVIAGIAAGKLFYSVGLYVLNPRRE